MLRALDVANYFLSLVNEDSGDTISNLKLQKLLYYAQGYHLAVFDKPLFPDRIMAWQHGPVVPNVYHHFKEYGNEAIPKPSLDLRDFNKKTRDFLAEVYRVIGQFSAWKLRNMTHAEPPWVEASVAGGGVITQASLKAYFKTLAGSDEQ